MSVACPATKSPCTSQKCRVVLQPVRLEPAIRQWLEANLAAEPFAQEHARLQHFTLIAIEALCDLAPVELGSLRQDRQHLRGGLRGGLLLLEFLALRFR